MTLLTRLGIVARVLLLLVASPWLLAADEIPWAWDDVARIVVIGDIHGDYDNYFTVLQEAGLVNRRGNWTGEDTHFIQLGDIPDRGPDTAKVLEHLQKLEEQARRRGGMVHVLVGNHEFMNVTGDLRYVHPGEYKAFISRDSARYRDAYYQQTVQAVETQNATREEPILIDDAFRTRWLEQFPLGFVEHRLAWQAGGAINAWVGAHNSIIRINDILFMHAGLGPDMLGMTIPAINDRIRAEMAGGYNVDDSLGDAQTGPLWYRGLAQNPEVTEAPHLATLLDTYQVKTVIVGHTPDLGVITPRFGGQVIVADTGISAFYGGHRASVLIEDGLKFALQAGEYTPLPVDEEGVIPYFREMAALIPDNARLAAHLQGLLNPPEPGEAETATEETPLPD